MVILGGAFCRNVQGECDTMRKSIREFVGIVADTLPIIEPVYEFGSLQVIEDKALADLRPLFAGKEYVGCDMRPGPGVDKVLDLHKIELPDETAGTVLVMDTLEHVEFARRAMEEVHRILKPNGMAVISSVMKFAVHGHPNDYWRFTTEGFKSLLRPFATTYVELAGRWWFPHTVVGVGFKSPVPQDQLRPFQQRVEAWKNRWEEPTGSRLHALVRGAVPYGLIEWHTHVKRTRRLKRTGQ